MWTFIHCTHMEHQVMTTVGIGVTTMTLVELLLSCLMKNVFLRICPVEMSSQMDQILFCI